MKIAISFICDEKFTIGLDSVLKNLYKYDREIINHDIFIFTDSDAIKKKYTNFFIRDIDTTPYNKIPCINNRLKKSYYKFEILNLLNENYDRIIFLDCDLLILNSISLLYSKELNDQPIYMAKDDGIKLAQKIINTEIYKMNAGVMVINNTCDTNIKSELIDMSYNHSFNDADQTIFNMYITKYLNGPINYLPMEYNCLKRIYYHHKKIWKNINDKIKILHFVGNDKPWNKNIDKNYTELNLLWKKHHQE